MKYKRTDCIGKALKRLLERMGIEGYTGYSFRHSMIQALFDAGLDEKQVNAYTGHSNNAHTAVNFYYHLNRMWAAQKLRAAPTDRVQLRDEVLEIMNKERAQILEDDDVID
jgi:integrase